MREIKVRLPTSLIASLEEEAQFRKISRAELMREKLTNLPPHESISPDVFYQTVNKVRRKIGNILTRSQAENVVAACLIEFRTLETN